MKIFRKMFSKKEKEATTDEKVAQIKKKGKIGRALVGTTIIAPSAIISASHIPTVKSTIKTAKETAEAKEMLNQMHNFETKLEGAKKAIYEKIKKGTASTREKEAHQALQNYARKGAGALRETEEFIRNHDKEAMKKVAAAGKKAKTVNTAVGATLLAAPVVLSGIGAYKWAKKNKAYEDKAVNKLREKESKKGK